MNLMFAQSRDQALLALAIQESAKVAQSSGKWLGRTAVQKIMYFLKVRGVPSNYRFDIYHYGPFCEQILWDIDLLLADGVIQDKSINTEKFSNYEAGKSINELVKIHKGELETFEKQIKEIVGVLAPLTPNELELISTLDYLYREQAATGKKENLKNKVVARFMEIKKDKFPKNVVSKSYDAMVTAKLVKA